MPSTQASRALVLTTETRGNATVTNQLKAFCFSPPNRKRVQNLNSNLSLPQDALQVVLNALPLEDFLSARLCCRGWKATADSAVRDIEAVMSLPVCESDCRLKVQSFSRIFPLLRNLHLKVTVHDGPSADACLQEFLTCVQRCRNLVDSLMILELEAVVPPRLAWVKHGTFPRLQSLRITRPSQLRGLLSPPTSRKINFSTLSRLTSLRELKLQARVSLDMLEKLELVTQLRALHILPLLWSSAPDGVNRYEWLSSLQHLNTLSICNHANLFDEDGAGVSWEEAQVVLGLPRLKRLCCRISDVDVAESMCSHMELTNLSLAYDGLDLPGFLSACEGSRALTQLHLRIWNGADVYQLNLLSNITHLQALHVCGPDDSSRPPVCADLSALSQMQRLLAFTYESGETFAPPASYHQGVSLLQPQHSLLQWLSHSCNTLRRLVLTLEDHSPLDMDLSVLSGLTRLRELSMKISPFAPVQPLHLPPNITHLSLVASTYIKLMRPYALLHHLSPYQISSQGALPRLQSLELGRCALPRGLLSALALTRSHQLHTIIMRDVANLCDQDVCALSNLTRLRHLHVTLNWQEEGHRVGWDSLSGLSRLKRLQHLHWRMTQTWGCCSKLGCCRIVDDFNCALLVAHRTVKASAAKLLPLPKVQLSWLTNLTSLSHLDLFDHHSGRLITPTIWAQLQPHMPYLTYDDSY